MNIHFDKEHRNIQKNQYSLLWVEITLLILKTQIFGIKKFLVQDKDIFNIIKKINYYYNYSLSTLS